MFDVVSFPVSMNYESSSAKFSYPRIKQAPVAKASETKVIFLGPMHRISVVAQSDASKKMSSAPANCTDTSYDFRALTRAKNGMTNVTRRKPTSRAKKANRVRLLRKAVRGTWLYRSDLMKLSVGPRSALRRAVDGANVLFC